MNVLRLLTLVCLCCLFACTKVPDEGYVPVDQTTSGNYPKTFADLESFLASGYSNFRKSFNLYGFEILTKHFASLEHSASLDYKDDRDWNELATHNITAPNPYVTKLWTGLYTGIKNVNVFLDRADFYEQHFAQPAEITSINQLRGEAYFLRAWYYFQLECFFGESTLNGVEGADKKGVPLVVKMPGNQAETAVPRATVKATWDFIIGDLQQSATLLAGVVRSGDKLARVTEWSAKGLLGKAYVFTGQYDLAKTVLKDVIDNSGKTLMPFDKYSNSFNALPEANEFNQESLFEINVERKSSGTGIFTAQTSPTDLTTSAGLLWGPMILALDGTETGGGNTELTRVNIFVHDKNIRRFGYTLPVFDTILNPNFSGTPSRTNPQFIVKPDQLEAARQARLDKLADPRLYVAALEPWADTVNNKDGTARVPIARSGHLGNIYQTYGWSFKKYCTIDRSIYFYNDCDGANYYLLRMADVYLLYAEACIKTGDAANGLEYINKVHRRAYGVPFNIPSSYDYTSLTANTKAAGTDVSLANNPLAFERFAEFFAEGQWWFDVCRWKIGDKETNYYKTALPDGTPIAPWDNKMYYYPIPSLEMSTNKGLTGADQNPGY